MGPAAEHSNPETSTPCVWAIVLNWNLYEETVQCIEGLLSQSYPNMKVLLVDNGSMDGSPEKLRERFRDIEVIENRKNLGYAEGNNVGIRRALEGGADYLFIINNDALAEKDAVERLVECAERNPAIAVVGAKTLLYTDPSVIYGAWGVKNYRNVVTRIEGENCPDGERYEMERDVDYVLGCAFLVRGEAARRVGLMDPEYFAYHDELDWCERLRKEGWRVVFSPGARVLHRGSLSLKRAGASLARDYFLARNSVRFIKKHGNTLQQVKFFTFVLLATVLKTPLEAGRGRLRAHLERTRGYLDGIRARPLTPEILQRLRLDK